MGGFLPMIFQLVGYAVGGPMGAVVGSIVGAVLFGTQSGSSEGPRARDLKVQSSAYGTAIAIVWGCARLAGNIIWSSGILESVRQETSGGGLLGGGATLTTYTYSTDLAIAICEGPIDEVRRIWANGRLIYDRTGTSDKFIPEGFQLRIYKGTEDQEPDPYMAANRDGKDVGGGLGVDGLPVAGLVPAYRGTAYVLFTNFQLEVFGNQVPQFEFEVVIGEPEPVHMDRLPDLASFNAVPGSFSYNYANGMIYAIGDGGTKLAVVDPRTLQVVSQGNINAGGSSYSLDSTTGRVFSSRNGPFSLGSDIRVSSAGGTSEIEMNLVEDFDRQEFIHSGPTFFNPLEGDPNKAIVTFSNGGLYTGSSYFVNGRLSPYRQDKYMYEVFTLPPDLPARRLSTLTEPGRTKGTIVATSALNVIGNQPPTVFVYGMEGGGLIAATEGLLDGRILHKWAYDQTRDRIWLGRPVQINGQDVLSLMYYDVQGYPPDDPQPTEPRLGIGPWVAWRSFDPSEFAGTSFAFAYNETFDAMVIYGYPQGADSLGAVVRLYDVVSGQLLHEAPVGGEILQQLPATFAYSRDDYMVAFTAPTSFATSPLNTVGKLYFGMPLSANGVGLAGIVADLCRRAGLPPEDIDVTELADKVKGYVVAKPMTVRAAIEPLMSAYFFDGVETGGDPPGPE